MRLFLALVVLTGYIQVNNGITWDIPSPGQGRPGSQGQIDIGLQLPQVNVGLPRVGVQVGAQGQGGRILTNLEIQAVIRLLGERGQGQIAAAIGEIAATGRGQGIQVSVIVSELARMGITLSPPLIQMLKLELGIDFGINLSLGVDTKKVAQQAINSVKKLLKLAQGILVSVLKQLADFLKQYLPQIADTLVSLLNALLPPYVDALVGCAPPILDLIGMLIAECPKDPEVENSTTGGESPAQTPGGRPEGPTGGPPELGPGPVVPPELPIIRPPAPAQPSQGGGHHSHTAIISSSQGGEENTK